MNKQDFIKEVATKAGLSQEVAKVTLEAMIEVIETELLADKDVNITGFGKFKVTHRKARKGHNPKTGESIEIKAGKSPSFSAGKSFKEIFKK